MLWGLYFIYNYIGTMNMKKTTQVASLCLAVGAAVISSAAFADVNNCRSFYPKAPYNCVVTKAKSLPSERAEFSAFETGAAVASDSAAGNASSNRLRSVPRAVARKLRSDID